MRRIFCLLLMGLVIPHIYGFATFAQIQIGTITGVVLDSTGAILADAHIILENPITGFAHRTSSDSKGSFTFNNVPFALYSLRVEATGFQNTFQQLAVHSNL